MKITSFLKKRWVKYGIGAIVILAVIWFLFFKGGNGEKEPLVIQKGDFLQQVSVSGKIIATENVDLSFEQSGQIRSVYAKEGDKVFAGKLLASQDTAQLNAQLAEMQAGIDLQQAKLDQLLDGASSEDIRISENDVTSAKQDLDNAYDDAVTVLDSAYIKTYNASTAVLYLQNNYFTSQDQEGVKVSENKNIIDQSVTDAKKYLGYVSVSGDAGMMIIIDHIIAGLNDTYNALNVIRNQCDVGAYYAKVSSTDKASLDTHKANINTVLTSVKSAKQDILDYKIALEQAENKLALTKAPARTADIAVYQAQIAQAKAAAQNVLAQLRKRQIYSPMNGIVTKVDAKAGASMSAGQLAISVISDDPLLIESYIPEIYVSLVKVGHEATVILDAYGDQAPFMAEVASIDPAETMREGVSMYRAKLQFVDKDERIRSGMTSNVVITTDKRENTIAIPQGIIINKDGKKFVKVQEIKNIIEREVTAGLISSLGKIEIISGLKEGDVVVVE